jgi:hypothetical protein
MIARGEQRAYLWVFDANVGTVDLYRRLGGETTEQGFDDSSGWRTRVVWRDVTRLIGDA